MSNAVFLSDLCSLITKGTTPTTTGGGFAIAGINFIKSESLSYDGSIDEKKFAFIDAETHRKLKRSQISEGDILYSIAGVNLGKCGMVKAHMLPANTNQAVAIIRVDPTLASARFISYFLRNTRFVQGVLNGVAQSAQPNVNLGDIGRFKIPQCSLNRQRAIASLLGALDDKIELNRQMNETLEATARLLFKDWFVDFGPTRAKAEGRPPYLAPELWSLFPDALDDDDKPMGWEPSTIGQEVRVVGGSTPSTKEPFYWDGEFCWATPKDLSTLKAPVLLKTERRITQAGISQISSGLLPVGTLLLSSRAPIGYLAISEVETAVNQGFIAMVCEGRLTNVFVWLWTQANMDAILQKANGSTFLEISKTNFRPIPVIIASAAILKAFDAITQPLYTQIVANERESRTLTHTRDLLLPKLMSGEIRLREAEKLVEKVA